MFININIRIWLFTNDYDLLPKIRQLVTKKKDEGIE